MQIDTIKQKIFSNSYAKDELFFFSKKKNWNKFTKRDYHYSNFLGPFSKNYFSPLNPAFLFEMNKAESFKNLSVVTARDGILTLLKFFNKYPTPPSNYPIILIDEVLEMLIPLEWSENVKTYRIVKTDLLKKKEASEIENIFIFLYADQFQSSSEYVERTFQKIQNYIGKDELKNKKVYTCTRHEFDYIFHDQYLEEKHYQYFDILRLYKEYFPGQRKEIKAHQIEVKNKTDSLFTVINQNNFYFSDDFFRHEFLGDGAYPLDFDTLSPRDPSKVINISPYHGVEMNTPNSTQLEKVKGLREGFYSFILEEEETVTSEDSHYVCSDRFFEYATSVLEVLRDKKSVH